VVTICTTSLTFNNSTFCPHSVFMCFVWISEQTAVISLYNINWLVCIIVSESVYCAVRNGHLTVPAGNLGIERVKYEGYWTRISLYCHRRERNSANGLQDSGTFSVAVPSAVGTDRLAAHRLLMWEFKNKPFRNAGLCRFKNNMITWYRSVTNCQIAVRERRMNDEACWLWGKAPWRWRTIGLWIEIERRGIQFGEWMLTVAINSVLNMKEHLAEVTSCDSKNSWRFPVVPWPHLPPSIRCLCLQNESWPCARKMGNDF